MLSAQDTRQDNNRIDNVSGHVELLKLHRRERHVELLRLCKRERNNNNGIGRVRVNVKLLRLRRRESQDNSETESEGLLRHRSTDIPLLLQPTVQFLTTHPVF